MQTQAEHCFFFRWYFCAIDWVHQVEINVRQLIYFSWISNKRWSLWVHKILFIRFESVNLRLSFLSILETVGGYVLLLEWQWLVGIFSEIKMWNELLRWKCLLDIRLLWIWMRSWIYFLFFIRQIKCNKIDSSIRISVTFRGIPIKWPKCFEKKWRLLHRICLENISRSQKKMHWMALTQSLSSAMSNAKNEQKPN